MYDNEIYDHEKNGRPMGGVTGNFSGAGSTVFHSAETAGGETAEPQPSAYFNHLDDEIKTPQEDITRSEQQSGLQPTADMSVQTYTIDTGSETPVRPQLSNTESEAPVRTQLSNTESEAPAQAQLFNTGSETPAQAQLSNTESDTPAQAQLFNIESDTTVRPQVTDATAETPVRSQVTDMTVQTHITNTEIETPNNVTGAYSRTQMPGAASEATARAQVSGDAARARSTAGAASASTWTQAPVQHPADRKPGHEEKKMGLGQKIMLSISLGLFFGIFAGIGFFGVMQMNNAVHGREQEVLEETGNPAEQKMDEIVEDNTPQIQQAGSNMVYAPSLDSSVTGIVKDVMPAMVSIINNYTEITSFWGQTYKEQLSASGSGIIVAENGEELLIVTNQHVVADADQLLVTLSDDTEVEAKIKGMDADMDLAVIAIRLDDLSSKTMSAIAIASLGDSDELELGERVIAIGNALGYGQSVTVGYISALNRELKLDDGSVRLFIQTDAAINPGNSGGALLNSAGEVIGINSNKIGGSSIEGMGYAIPITAASPIIADLMERQTRNKVADSDLGYMGIAPQDISSQIAQMYGMPEGVYVLTVYEGSGAAAAGIVKGDIITKFDGQKISSYANLQELMQYYAVGDTVKVTLMRPENGEYVEYELTLTLGRKPDTRSRSRY